MSCPPSIRLMIVDANPSVQEGLSTFLGTKADMCLVASATSGAEAIVRFLEHRPNVILMDLILPDMSGTELMQTLLQKDHNLEFIILQRDNGPNVGKMPVEIGEVPILRKSVSGAKIARTIRTSISRRNGK